MRRGCHKARRAVPRGRTQCGWRTLRCEPARQRTGWRKPALPDPCLGGRSRQPERLACY